MEETFAKLHLSVDEDEELELELDGEGQTGVKGLSEFCLVGCFLTDKNIRVQIMKHIMAIRIISMANSKYN